MPVRRWLWPAAGPPYGPWSGPARIRPAAGPLAALDAGLRRTTAPYVVVLSADLPFLEEDDGTAAAGRPADDRHAKACCSPTPTAATSRSSPRTGPTPCAANSPRSPPSHGGLTGLPLRRLTGALDLTRITDPVASFDCDTWDDIAAARARIREHGHVLDEWISAVKEELGIDLDVDTGLLLDLARDAAHGVARPAAPLTTFLVGYAAARAEGGPEAVAEAARKVDGPGPALGGRGHARRQAGRRMTPEDAEKLDVDVEEALAMVNDKSERPLGTSFAASAFPPAGQAPRRAGTPGQAPTLRQGHPSQGHPLARGPRSRRTRRPLGLARYPSLRPARRRPWPRPRRPPHCPHRPPVLRHLRDGRLGGRGTRPLGRRRGRGARRARRARTPLTDGEAVRIATGARIPPDTTAVLRSEHGRTDDKGRLYATRDVVHGQDIRPRGQECRSGDQLLPPGHAGHPGRARARRGRRVRHRRRRSRARAPKSSSSATSCSPRACPHDGLIRDALGPMLPPWLRALGADVTAVRRLGDDADALYEALKNSPADLIVTTGGTAAGPVDHVHPTLRRLGAELLVDGVKVRPGHPMLLARTKGEPAPRRAPRQPSGGRLRTAHPRRAAPADPRGTRGSRAVHSAPEGRGARPPVRHPAHPRRSCAATVPYRCTTTAPPCCVASPPPTPSLSYRRAAVAPARSWRLLDLPWATAGGRVCFT